nr:immunoglobulin light chain junction region [Macaca mulatta]MOY05232.1 immunoglobulin light chain junction region [Macaca mulatta]MOY05276.1 immunoglobulin light chain junction region [Macaca mulatta]MOY05381.1 immunoglobulin light chain junction region [Macaca mulatta]MOY05510.1 immunoglobulin light chain junction region [Macaca mulatta]
DYYCQSYDSRLSAQLF